MTKFPWKLKYMAKYILKVFFLTTFPSTQKKCPKMLLHWCCPLIIGGHKKITYTNFQILLKISLAVIIEIVDLTLRAVIDFFELYTVNSFIKKKFKIHFIGSKTLFRTAQLKQKKYYHYF